MRVNSKIGQAARVVLRLAVILAGSSLLCQAQTWTWTEETIDNQPARFPSIATDSDGDVHLIYSSDMNGFKYGYRPAGSKRWFTMPVEGGAGFTSIALDAKNNPHVCLAINTSGIIEYGSYKDS